MNAFQEGLQQEQKRRAATQKRIRILFVMVALVVIARLFIPNPEPPKKAIHNDKPFRALPGMLARMPSSEKAKLTPTMLAKLQDADRHVLSTRPESVVVSNPVKLSPAQLALQDKLDYENEKYFYAKRAHARYDDTEKPSALALRQTTLVMLSNGRYLKVEKADKRSQYVEVVLSERQIEAHLPNSMVTSISHNALTWKEPIPQGFTVLKPAKGITIQLAKASAKRVTIQPS